MTQRRYLMFHDTGTAQLCGRTKERIVYIPLCSLSTPVASKSGSPRLMSLTRVPTHSIWSTLHHSSASRSVGRSKRFTCKPGTHLKAERKSPSCLTPTWFTSKGLGGVIAEINPYGVFLGGPWQSNDILHTVKFRDLKHGQWEVCSHSANECFHWATPNQGQAWKVGGTSQMKTAWQKSVYATAMNYFSVILTTLQRRLTNYLSFCNFLKHIKHRLYFIEVKSVF